MFKHKCHYIKIVITRSHVEAQRRRDDVVIPLEIATPVSTSLRQARNDVVSFPLMRIFLGQINPKIGDIEGNLQKILSFCSTAKSSGANLAIFPEMSLIGYPPKDLILKPQLIEKQNSALDTLSQITDENFGIIVGGVSPNQGFGRKLFNSLFCLANSKLECIAHKTLLPSYDVFDETRYFEAAKDSSIWQFRGNKIGLSICEDIWIEKLGNLYTRNPITDLVAKDAEIIINCSASPYTFGKSSLREEILFKTCKQFKKSIIYINQVGANDELIFDGASLVFNSKGDLIHKLKSFQEDQIIIDTNEIEDTASTVPEKFTENVFSIIKNIDQHNAAELEQALVLGTRDYIHKCGFSKVVIGLSGGIDSALVAYIASKALGPQNVFAYMLPSEFTSKSSYDDAEKLAIKLGINYQIVKIEDLHNELRKLIPNLEGLVDENLQPRIRASILMAFANSLNALLLSTSNKSEIAVGYSTLYGDSCGAIAVIGDLLKTTIYKLCENINREDEIIPTNILKKAPSAELRHDQKDSDSLPDYAVLDEIILLYIQELKSQKEIIELGYEHALVKKVLNMIDRAEYKRQQAPPILKVASKAFGQGRRMPIAQGFVNE